jgi:lysophospholipase L1-like esterase
MRIAKVKKTMLYALFLLGFTCLAAEIILRMYNPFSTSVTGDRITLHTNTRTIIKNGPNANGLDEESLVLKNSLGFRGPEPPADFNQHLTIVAVGGSTTECLFVPEGKTWTALLADQLQSSFNKVWLNNAGLNGHSTYGHIKLVKDYITELKPDYCLFLVGCNDVDRADLGNSDKTIGNGNQNFVITLARYSKLANVSLNFYRHHLASERELVNNKHFALTGKEPLVIDDRIITSELNRQLRLVKRYGSRIRELITLCRQAGIEPVFITQPCLPGDTVDDVTGIDLATLPVDDKRNGRLVWKMLQLYNDETRAVCKEQNVFLVDLAILLPKSSKYFYDVYHFNNEGCRMISSIVKDSLSNYLSGRLNRADR